MIWSIYNILKDVEKVGISKDKVDRETIKKIIDYFVSNNINSKTEYYKKLCEKTKFEFIKKSGDSRYMFRLDGNDVIVELGDNIRVVEYKNIEDVIKLIAILKNIDIDVILSQSQK